MARGSLLNHNIFCARLFLPVDLQGNIAARPTGIRILSAELGWDSTGDTPAKRILSTRYREMHELCWPRLLFLTSSSFLVLL